MRQCEICGRPMIKCLDSIGPTCLRKLKQKYSIKGANKKQIDKILRESIPDMFLEGARSGSREN